MGWVVNATVRPLYPREQPGTHCVGGYVGRRAAPEGAESLAPNIRHIIYICVCGPG